MLTVKGVFVNEKIILEKKIKSKKQIKVLVTFLEDIEKTSSKSIGLKRFSFAKSKKFLKDYKGSLSDAVIEERRNSI